MTERIVWTAGDMPLPIGGQSYAMLIYVDGRPIGWIKFEGGQWWHWHWDGVEPQPDWINWRELPR